MDDEQERGLAALLVDEGESAASANRVLADTSASSSRESALESRPDACLPGAAGVVGLCRTAAAGRRWRGAGRRCARFRPSAARLSWLRASRGYAGRSPSAMKRWISRDQSGCLAAVTCPRPSNTRNRLPGINRAVSAKSSGL